MGLSQQEYWSRQPFPSPGSLPNPEIEPGSPARQADYLPSEPPGKPMCSILAVVPLFRGETWQWALISAMSVPCTRLSTVDMCAQSAKA